MLIWGSVGTALPTPITNTPINVGGILIRAYDLLVLGAATAVMVSLFVFLNQTKRGAAMQAAAMDYDAATAVGINVASSNGQALHASAPAWPRSPAGSSGRCSTSASAWAARSASGASRPRSSAASGTSPARSSADLRFG